MTGNLPPAPQGTDGQWSPDRSWAAGDALLTQPLDLTVVQAVVEPPASAQAPRPSRLGVGLAVLGALLALWPAWETVGMVRFNLSDAEGAARFAASSGLNVLFVVIGVVAAVLLALALLRRRSGRGAGLGTLLLGVAVAGIVVAIVLDAGLLVTDGWSAPDALVVELGKMPGGGMTWWVAMADLSAAVWAVALAVLVSSGSRTPRHAPGGAPDA